MGSYRDIQTNVQIHRWPDWYTSGGFINQDTDTVYFSASASGSGRYGYTIEIYLVKVDTSGGLHYDSPIVSHTGHTDFSGTKTGCGMNDRSIASVYLAMYCSMSDDKGGPCTITGPASGNPGGGDETYAADTKPGMKIPGTELTLQHVVAPTIGNIRNTNPYNGNSGISASTSSISVAASHTGGDAPTYWQYSVNNGAWTNCSSSVTISGLGEGTSRTIRMRAGNEAGTSNTLSITIRTRYNAPVVSANISNIGLEGFRINWSSNKTMKSIRYKIDNVRDWTSSNVSATSGNINVTNLSPATRYTVRVSGYSSNSYDGLLSNEVVLTVTTLDIAKISSISAITHGEEFTVNITNPSGSSCTLELWVEGNGDTTTITKTTTATITVTPTESEWDSIYRRYPAANTVTMHALLTTHGIKDYNDTTKTQIITLTGIQKTAHFGVDNKPRRVQVWVGDSSGKARRAVAWVGAEGGTKRTI